MLMAGQGDHVAPRRPPSFPPDVGDLDPTVRAIVGAAREQQPGFAEAFLPGGRAPAAGERFGLPEHAATLETIAATGGDAFYRGELAATMAAHSTTNGGAMLASDLACHTRGR